MARKPKTVRTAPHPRGDRPREPNGRPAGLPDSHPAVVEWQQDQAAAAKVATKVAANKPAHGGK